MNKYRHGKIYLYRDFDGTIIRCKFMNTRYDIGIFENKVSRGTYKLITSADCYYATPRRCGNRLSKRYACFVERGGGTGSNGKVKVIMEKVKRYREIFYPSRRRNASGRNLACIAATWGSMSGRVFLCAALHCPATYR